MNRFYSKSDRSILDNRKFFTQTSIEYEKDVHSIVVKGDNNLEEQQNYTYGLPLQDDIYMYRYDSFLSGVRDHDTDIVPYTDFTLPKPKQDAVPPPSPSLPAAPTKENFSEHVCGIDDDGVVSICGKDKKNLYSIMDPRFNLREAAKNMILLEDHLFQCGKRCQDCILKHCLTIEGFIEEGITLDKKQEYQALFKQINTDFRAIFKALAASITTTSSITEEECVKYAQEIRKIRKPLCQQFATFF